MLRVTHISKSRQELDGPCDACGLPIKIGSAYKWYMKDSVRIGRHESCPDWHPWTLSDSVDATWQHAVHMAVEGVAVSNSVQDVFDILQAYSLYLARLSYLQQIKAKCEKGPQAKRTLFIAAALEAKSMEIMDFIREFDEEEQECRACFGKGTRYSMSGPVTCIVCGGSASVPFNFETWRDSLAGSQLLGIPS